MDQPVVASRVCRWDLPRAPPSHLSYPGRSNNAAPSEARAPARVSRISLKTTRAFTCGSRKDWRWVDSRFLPPPDFSFFFFFFFRSQRDFVVSHEIPDVFLTLSLLANRPPDGPRARSRAHGPRKTCARPYDRLTLPLGLALSRSRVFTFSTKSLRLCARLLRLPTK